jgi:hypothetical protein
VSRAALAALVFGLLAFAPAASASPPQVTLLGPANGATLAYPAYATAKTTFSWHISWDAPEATTVMFQLGTDRDFAPGTYTQENFGCTAADPNCTSSYTPQRSYYPPYPKVFYWRVGLTAAGGYVWSSTSTFKVVNLADHVRPRVRVYSGSATRGSRAYLRVRAADDRGRVRAHVTLTYHGRALYNARMPMSTTYWADPLFFYTRRPLPRFLPTGLYQACVKVWDEAGNSARGCAPYRIR